MKSHWIAIVTILFMLQVMIPQGLSAGTPEPITVPDAIINPTTDWVVAGTENRADQTWPLSENLGRVTPQCLRWS